MGSLLLYLCFTSKISKHDNTAALFSLPLYLYPISNKQGFRAWIPLERAILSVLVVSFGNLSTKNLFVASYCGELCDLVIKPAIAKNAIWIVVANSVACFVMGKQLLLWFSFFLFSFF